MLKNDILELLQTNETHLSGEEIAAKFSVSRAAVWKCIQNLKKEGVPIEAIPNKGYKLEREIDVISAAYVASRLRGEARNVKIEVIESTSSTNDYLKNPKFLAEKCERVVIAKTQTQGRGRRKRSFFCSPDSGLYMSVLLRPRFDLNEAIYITPAAAAAAAEAAETLSGKRCGIKWVNDIFLDGKKICGILTEASLSLENTGVDYVIVGLGVNVYYPQELPEELISVVGSIYPSRAFRSRFRSELAAEILNRFFEYYARLSEKPFFENYVSRSIVLGKNINVLKNGKTLSAKALSIESDCRLKVAYEDGKEEILSGEEISIRLN